MGSSFGVGIGVFLGLLVTAIGLLTLDEMTPQMVPGALFFSGLSAILPSIFSIGGFEMGRRYYPSRLATKNAILLGVSLGVLFEAARNAPLFFKGPIAVTGAGYLGALFLGGFGIALIARQRARHGTRDAGPVKRTTSQSIALVELVFLVYPTLILLPFLVLLVVVERFDDFSHLVCALGLFAIAGAALVALIGLLGAFLKSGRNGLAATSRSWWVWCVAGIALVIVGTPVFLFQVALGESDPGLWALLGVGICGVPAAIPAFHMLFERWKGIQVGA